MKDIANLIFPDIKLKIDDLEKKYPKRDLSVDKFVTRFAPSPTGFLHTGSLFTSLISYHLAKQTNGVFYIRLEDTDTKREVEGSSDTLIKQLKDFDITPDEGFISNNKEIGIYGPYKQSQREDIYKIVIKELIEKGYAYPCFCTHEDLDKLREKQEKEKIIPGYYSKYAKCRNLSKEEVIKRIKNGDKYIIRFKSFGNHENKIKVHDLIKGDLELTENDQDIVILKSDGLPTYHFAHLVDDHFMRTTHVTRGEEWLSSLPIHVDLFKTMKWDLPKYAHLPVIMKNDENSRRKLSKRKDKEASVSFFLEQGYPVYGIIEYLLTLANSNYEAWRCQNLDKSYNEFKISFDKMSKDGALFDIEKIDSISKDRIALKTKEELFKEVYNWSEKYDINLYNRIKSDKKLFESILGIDKDKEKPRKDYAKYSDIFPKIAFFYDDIYNLYKLEEFEFNYNFKKDTIIKSLNNYIENINVNLDEKAWFEDVKQIALKSNFSPNPKEFKQDPKNYYGHIGDYTEFLRVALTSKKSAPNLYYIIKILGKDKVINRIKYVIKYLEK